MPDPNRWTPEHGYQGAVRFHAKHEWFFTRMPNGDVMVSAGDGVQMVTLAPNEWESVVREMAEAYQSDTDSPDPTAYPEGWPLPKPPLGGPRPADNEVPE